MLANITLGEAAKIPGLCPKCVRQSCSETYKRRTGFVMGHTYVAERQTLPVTNTMLCINEELYGYQ